LKCGPFEQNFTNFGWIFVVRILGLEGERNKVKSETVKMGGELPFILQIRPEYVIQATFYIFGFFIPEDKLIIFAGRVRRA